MKLAHGACAPCSLDWIGVIVLYRKTKEAVIGQVFISVTGLRLLLHSSPDSYLEFRRLLRYTTKTQQVVGVRSVIR